MGVDPGRTILKPRGRRQALADVRRPYRRGKAVVAVVRPFDRLVDIVEACHRHDWPENFLANDLILLPRASNDGRLEEKALAAGCFAPGGDLHVLLLRGAVNEIGNTRLLCL